MKHENNTRSELTPLKSHFSDDERRENDSFLCSIGLEGQNKIKTSETASDGWSDQITTITDEVR